MDKQQIGLILKQARESAGMTQSQVARIVGKTQQAIGNWETGYSTPEASMLFTLCDLYGLSIDDTFGGGQHVRLTLAERNHIKLYRSLDAFGKEMVDYVLKKEAARIEEYGPLSKDDTSGKPMSDEEAIALASERYGAVGVSDDRQAESV